MLIDHTAASAVLGKPSLFWLGLGTLMGAQEHYELLRAIGRIAFPIFAFQLVEGVRHTKNKWKYLFRLALLGVVSEFPFDLALFGQWSDWNHQNVYFTLLLGFIAVVVIQWAGRLPGKKRIVGGLVAVAATAISATTAYVLCTDYDYKGVIFIAILGLLTLPEVERLTYPASVFVRAGISAVAILTLAILCIPLSGNMEFYGLFALIPIALYNGKKGYNKGIQMAAYAFYPVHLLILGLIFTLPVLIK